MDVESRPLSDTELIINEELVTIPARKVPTITSVDLDGLLQKPLQLQEDVKGGCGGQVWPAGEVLAKYIIRRHSNNLVAKQMFVSSQWL